MQREEPYGGALYEIGIRCVCLYADGGVLAYLYGVSLFVRGDLDCRESREVMEMLID